MFNDADFIKLVQSHKNLYDKRNGYYEDERVKASSWRAIAVTMNTSDDEVIKRWTALRKRFIEHRKKLSQIASGLRGFPVKPWPLYELLRFLNVHVPMRVRQITPMAPLPQPPDDLEETSDLDPLTPLDFESIYEDDDVDESSQARHQETTSTTTITDAAVAPSSPTFFDQSAYRSRTTSSISETSNSEPAAAASAVPPPASPSPPPPLPNLQHQRTGTKRKHHHHQSASDLVGDAHHNGIAYVNHQTESNDHPHRQQATIKRSNDAEGAASVAFGQSIGLQLNLIRSPAARLLLQAKICTLMAEAFRKQENPREDAIKNETI